MNTYQETEADLPRIIEQLRRLAGTRKHNISRQLAHPEQLTLKAAQSMRSYLNRQPDKRPAPSAGSITAQVHQASAAATQAAVGNVEAEDTFTTAPHNPYACGHEEHAGAMGVPVSREDLDARLNAEAEEKDVAHQRYQASQRAPAAERLRGEEDEGYYLHDSRMYKVATSQYGASQGHLFARKLNEQTGDWDRAQGMTSYLRKSERVTLEVAIEFGRDLRITPSMALYGRCWICHRVLTDEQSIRDRVGPGPHKGIDC